MPKNYLSGIINNNNNMNKYNKESGLDQNLNNFDNENINLPSNKNKSWGFSSDIKL